MRLRRTRLMVVCWFVEDFCFILWFLADWKYARARVLFDMWDFFYGSVIWLGWLVVNSSNLDEVYLK